MSVPDAPLDRGAEPAIGEVVRQIRLVAAVRSTMLITGETGTGKELVARAIHQISAQRQMPFIRVNCAAVPETLLESELFGHVRGAFTGASHTRRDIFEPFAQGRNHALDRVLQLTEVAGRAPHRARVQETVARRACSRDPRPKPLLVKPPIQRANRVLAFAAHAKRCPARDQYSYRGDDRDFTVG